MQIKSDMFFIDAFLKGLKPQFDDDGIDRLNYYYTPMLIIIFSLTLSAKQYVGQPIQCWIPAQFTGAWEQYSENYCFVQNTFFVNPKEHIPDSVEQREAQEIGYYQWVPFILGLQAILFYMPQLVWRCFNWQSGMSLKSLVKMAKDVTSMAVDQRNGALKVVAAHIHDSLGMQQKLQKFSGLLSFSHKGGYLTTLYLLVKCLYLVQVFCQFIILNNFLSTSSVFWGFGILSDLFAGREWEESGHFPRVTMCDFDVRVLGNKHRHTVQCVLMINMFNEKVYLFLWFWLLGVFVATLLNLVCWIVHMSSEDKRKRFVSTYLLVHKLIKPDEMTSERAVTRFVNNGLRSDGVLVMHLISSNAGDIVTTSLVAEMWERFLEDERELNNKPQSSLDDVDGFKEKAPLT